MKRSIRFYRDGLGFTADIDEEDPAVVFFSNQGTKLALYPREKLAEDISESDPPQGSGFGGITLAINGKSKEEVDEIVARAKAAGGKVVKEPQTVFWGGYSGYFTDPDGYYWEAAYSKNFRFDEQNMLDI